MSRLSGWLIYKKQEAAVNHAFIEKLMAAAEAVSVDLRLVFEEDICYGVTAGKIAVIHPPVMADFAIVRTINPLLTRQLESLGIVCFNGSRVAEICNDKALTYQFAAGLGVRLLDTYFISNGYFPVETIPFSFPMVLKQADGRGGKEVFLVNSVEEVAGIISDHPFKRFVLQEFCDNPGKDVRVFVVGDQVIGAVLRESATSFKANYTLGGSVRAYELSDSELGLVKKIAFGLGGDFVGIDFLLDHDGGFVFNEIEDVVGCRSLYVTSDVDAAGVYLKYIKEKMNGNE